MLQIDFWEQVLPFEYPFTISKGTKTHQHSLIVSLGQGRLRGFGEAPAINYYQISVKDMLDSISSKKMMLQRYALIDPQRFWHFLHHLIPGQNFLTCALDIASWDFFAKRSQVPLYKLINAPKPINCITDYTLGVSSLEEIKNKIVQKPWPIYKIKMASTDDIDLIRAARAVTDSPFRIDANESFHLEDAKRILPELKQLGVTLLEQPLNQEDLDGAASLTSMNILPIFADESCQTEGDVLKCAQSFNGINIKLTKCGGITPALRMISETKKLGLSVMLGNMNESIVGTSALIHLSGLADIIDADGPLLLKIDNLNPIHYNNGNITIDESIPGIGIGHYQPINNLSTN